MKATALLLHHPRGIAPDSRPFSNITSHNCAGIDNRTSTDANARHNDCADANMYFRPDLRIKIEAARHVMRKNHRVVVNHGAGGNMDALRPCPVNMRGRGNARTWMNIVPPNIPSHPALKRKQW